MRMQLPESSELLSGAIGQVEHIKGRLKAMPGEIAMRIPEKDREQVLAAWHRHIDQVCDAIDADIEALRAQFGSAK